MDAIEAIPTVEVKSSTSTESYIEVTSAEADGKITFTVGTTSALESRLDTLDAFLGTNNDQGLSELLAKKVDDVTGGSNGITIETTNTGDGRIATLSVTADTTATENSTNVVTSGAVFTAVKSALDAAAEAKQIAESKIAEVEVLTDADNYYAAKHIVVATDENKKVTITVTRSDEWSARDMQRPSSEITSVINGKMSNGMLIDDANLVDAGGSGMFKNNTNLTTYVGTLSKLTDGQLMFSGCTALTTFCADLSSLENGTEMFAGCTLSEESIIYIVDSLPAYTEGTHTIGLGTAVPAELKAEAEAKGWTVVIG